MSSHAKYYYITESFIIVETEDEGREVDLMRKEVGNYFDMFDKAQHVRNRMLEYLGAEVKKV